MPKTSGRKLGGGINSRVNREVGVRVGNRASVVNPRSVSQIGQQLSNHVTESAGKVGRAAETFYGGRAPSGGPGGIKLGNQTAAEAGSGPGSGREVMRSGAQGVHGSVNPGATRPGADKPIFPGFK
jgi:hypothetical protein